MFPVYGAFRCLGCLRRAIFPVLIHSYSDTSPSSQHLGVVITAGRPQNDLSSKSQTDPVIVQPLQTPLLFVPAGEFKECTILFSDVVTFTNICAQCEPIQIVLMLNSMYLRFDRLTTVHDVYKVGTDQKKLQKVLLGFYVCLFGFCCFVFSLFCFKVLKSSSPQHDCWLNHKILPICSGHTN